MTIDQLKYAIKKNKLTYLELKVGKDPLASKIAHFSAPSDELCNELEEFITECPAKYYKVEGRTSPSAGRDSAFHFDYHSDRTQVQGVPDAPFREKEIDLQGIKAQIKEEIQKEYELRDQYKELEDSKKDLKKKHEDLETTGGRFLMIVELVGPKVMEWIMSRFAPQLQGMLQPATANLQGGQPSQETMQDLANMSDQEKIDEAFRIFGVVGISADQLLEFAKILEAKPSLVNMLPMLKNL